MNEGRRAMIMTMATETSNGNWLKWILIIIVIVKLLPVAIKWIVVGSGWFGLIRVMLHMTDMLLIINIENGVIISIFMILFG